MKFKNPIIRGFNPDPVICKVNKDYYIATSTFQFFPGVQIYHSQDLVNWKLIDRPLSRTSQLDLKGITPGGGVQAPDLTYKNGIFYLVYTIVYSPTPKCFYVTTKKIGTRWSEPTYINSSGIDQSFFHDKTKTYVLTNECVNEKDFHGVFKGNQNRLFQGINIQEFCLKTKKLVGMPINIFKGTKLDITEAPHIYKKNNFYYLMVAEGGTGYEHCIIVARSKNLFGPYVVDPRGPILSATSDQTLVLQKAGHGSIVEDQKGNVWLAALASVPTKKGTRNGSPFGRETILLKYKWTKDKWLRNYYQKAIPQEFVDSDSEVTIQKKKAWFFDFTKLKKLPLLLWTVRQPITKKWANLSKRGLAIRGRNNITSLYDQSSVHQIWKSLSFGFETKIIFNPTHYKQKAGIIQKYSEYDQIFFNIAKKYNGQRMLQLGHTKKQITIFDEEIIINDDEDEIILKSIVSNNKIKFFYKLKDRKFNAMKKAYRIEMLFEQNASCNGYNGAVVGIFAQDEFQLQKLAIFKYLKYWEI